MNAKPANPPAATGKTRHNISLSEEVRQRGERLAELEKRSFSNLLEVLIDREFERQNAGKTTAA